MKLIGVWCSPHRINLIADSLTKGHDNLPTFASFKKFLDGFSTEMKNSHVSKVDIAYLNLLINEDPTKVTSSSFSDKVEPFRTSVRFYV